MCRFVESPQNSHLLLGLRATALQGSTILIIYYKLIIHQLFITFVSCKEFVIEFCNLTFSALCVIEIGFTV